MSDLAMELSKVVFKAEPGLLACDPGATARAAVAAAELLGVIMATTLQQKGHATYAEAMKVMFAKAHQAAVRTVEIAHVEAQNPQRTL